MDESRAVSSLQRALSLDAAARQQIEQDATQLVERIRASRQSGLMETFLAEYGLSTKEGIALMCLAEALLRVPDAPTIDALIQDKIVAADWGRHLGHSASPLVNASTWALMLTGKVISLDDRHGAELLGSLQGMVKRVGDPVVRQAVRQAMRVLGQQFVLGETIDQALQRGREDREQGYTHSYDMLGEAALTAEDARQYFLSYSKAISELSQHCESQDIRLNPGISVKFSALHPRYEFSQRERVLEELVARIGSLALQAKNARMGFNIDAEEADRLDLSLDIIEQVIRHPDLAGWDGFGVVVQAYSPRAMALIDWLHQLAIQLDRRIMVRLVKGAYWDSEIKIAQQQGLAAYPVFTRKVSTDLSYLACAKKLLDYSPHLYPQFATHNAHSVMAVIQMAGERSDFEFQRLHGMGESLYRELKKQRDIRCRVYAPVGVHRDLLAYLVRRLLENGANSSFVNQLMDASVAASALVRDPLQKVSELESIPNPRIVLPEKLFEPVRKNSSGWNLSDPIERKNLLAQRDAFAGQQWQAAPPESIGAPEKEAKPVYNPGDFSDLVGQVFDTRPAQVESAIARARQVQPEWASRAANERAACLQNIAEAISQNAPELIMLMTREAGKTLFDAISEVREAIDFCHYYGAEMKRIDALRSRSARGLFVCISPWNFPLAIFTGQIVAALVSGNAVIAKPAEQTSLIAHRVVHWMHQAGVPEAVLQCLPGDGTTIGAALVADPRIDGVCFTGSTETAQSIHRALASSGNPQAVLIAETGGINAMIIDSSTLLQQAVQDIVSSAFQSAGQRCSALRMLFVQQDIADDLINLLKGAMNELSVGDPHDLTQDIGPLIDADARAMVEQHCESLTAKGCLLHQISVNDEQRRQGFYVAPGLFELDSFEQLEQEIFGPVLHLQRYRAEQLDEVIEVINQRGYGLTMGIHSRVDERVQRISAAAKIGNIYVNRNQIGAVVASQPFGGEGLSGTGPKAGGPNYLYRFLRSTKILSNTTLPAAPGSGLSDSASSLAAQIRAAAKAQPEWNQAEHRSSVFEKMLGHCDAGMREQFQQFLQSLPELSLQTIDLPGPTGESNRLSISGRGVMLCLGSATDNQRIQLQILASLYLGNAVVAVDDGQGELEKFCSQLLAGGLSTGLLRLVEHWQMEELLDSEGLSGVILEDVDSETAEYRQLRQTLAQRPGRIVGVTDNLSDWQTLIVERALCIDTTASGGNTDLLASSG